MASAEGGSVPNGVGYAEGCPLSSQLRGLGSIVSSPSGVRGKAPAENEFWGILKATERSFLYLCDKNLRGTMCISISLHQILGDLSRASPPVIYAHEYDIADLYLYFYFHSLVKLFCCVCSAQQRVLSVRDVQGISYRLKDTPAATMKGLMMLDTVDEDVDDVELAYWAAVEDAGTLVDVDDSAVTSPLWVKVEQLMGCKLQLSHILATIIIYSFRSVSLLFSLSATARHGCRISACLLQSPQDSSL